MSQTFQQVLHLVKRGEVRISLHGYDELSADDISVKDVIEGISDARTVEEYPDYEKGPCVLVLQKDGDGKAIHVVWGFPKGADSPAVLVTAYRPNPSRWTDDFLRRKP